MPHLEALDQPIVTPASQYFASASGIGLAIMTDHFLHRTARASLFGGGG